MGTYAREKNRSLRYTVLWSIITGPTLRKQKKYTLKRSIDKSTLELRLSYNQPQFPNGTIK